MGQVFSDWDKVQDLMHSDWDCPTQLDRIEDKLDRLLALLEPNEKKRAHRPVQAQTDPDFEAFWSLYPRKVAKPAARRAWSGINATDKAQILRVLPAWADSWKGKDPTFIPHPSTWLNQQRWQDDVQVAVPKQSSMPQNVPDWCEWGEKNQILGKAGESMSEYVIRLKEAWRAKGC